MLHLCGAINRSASPYKWCSSSCCYCRCSNWSHTQSSSFSTLQLPVSILIASSTAKLHKFSLLNTSKLTFEELLNSYTRNFVQKPWAKFGAKLCDSVIVKQCTNTPGKHTYVRWQASMPVGVYEWEESGCSDACSIPHQWWWGGRQRCWLPTQPL